MIEKTIETNECRKLDIESFSLWLENSIKHLHIVFTQMFIMSRPFTLKFQYFLELVLYKFTYPRNVMYIVCIINYSMVHRINNLPSLRKQVLMEIYFFQCNSVFIKINY